MKKMIMMKINVVNPTLGDGDGNDVYTQNLVERLKKEAKIEVNMIKTMAEQDRKLITVIEYYPNSNLDIDNKKKYIIEVHAIPSNKRMLIDIMALKKKGILQILGTLIFAVKNPKYVMGIFKRGGTLSLNDLENRHILLVRTKEAAKLGGLKKYKIMPLANPTKLNLQGTARELHIGSIGFATRSKNLDRICELAKRLNIRCTLIASINKIDPQTKRATMQIAKELKDRYASDKIQIISNYVSEKEKDVLLANCTHFISAQDETWNVSWSMRDMAKYGKPVISVDNTQAREARAHIVKQLKDITIGYLKRTRSPIYPPDGFQILVRILKKENRNG